MKTAADVLATLNLAPAKAAQPFYLRVGDVGVNVLCPDPLRTVLVEYFAEALSDRPGGITVHLLPKQSLAREPDWQSWAREQGKAGRKDAICDLAGARLIRKVRSGVTFLQAPDIAVAFGPLEKNVSTVINFINTQILSACLRGGWELCHAAAVTGPKGALAIAGLSGGGKSTATLRMMNFAAARFVSNDRLLVRAGTPAQARGIPKHPRINPGTLLGNERLAGLLNETRVAELRAMPADDLWGLEEKHDLVISDVYGSNRVEYDAPLVEFWVLNWSRHSDAPTQVRDVDLAQRPDLLQAIMKSPGPFHQYVDGHFEPNGAAPVAAPYLSALRGVRICEVSGRVDFDAIADEAGRVLDA